MQLPQTLSPSSVGQFLKCPYKWYCDKASYPQIKTDDSALLFGKAIHMIIENYYTKIPEIITEKDIQKYLDESLIESGGWITDRFKTKTKKFYDAVPSVQNERHRIKLYTKIAESQRALQIGCNPIIEMVSLIANIWLIPHLNL